MLWLSILLFLWLLTPFFVVLSHFLIFLKTIQSCTYRARHPIFPQRWYRLTFSAEGWVNGKSGGGLLERSGQWLLMIICSLLEHPANAFISRRSARAPMQQPVQNTLQAAKHIVTEKQLQKIRTCMYDNATTHFYGYSTSLCLFEPHNLLYVFFL